jgi:hypothetical protein
LITYSPSTVYLCHGFLVAFTITEKEMSGEGFEAPECRIRVNPDMLRN